MLEVSRFLKLKRVMNKIDWEEKSETEEHESGNVLKRAVIYGQAILQLTKMTILATACPTCSKSGVFEKRSKCKEKKSRINNVEMGRLDHHQHKLELGSTETERHKTSIYDPAMSVSNKHYLNNSRGPQLDRGGTSVKNCKERSKIVNKYFHSIVGKIQNGIIVSHYIDFLSNSFVKQMFQIRC